MIMYQVMAQRWAESQSDFFEMLNATDFGGHVTVSYKTKNGTIAIRGFCYNELIKINEELEVLNARGKM